MCVDSQEAVEMIKENRCRAKQSKPKIRSESNRDKMDYLVYHQISENALSLSTYSIVSATAPT